MATAFAIGKGVLIVLGGMVVVLKVIAPITKTNLDNKAVKVLEKAADLLRKVVG